MVQGLRVYASRAEGVSSVPGQGTRIPQATWHVQFKKKEQGLGSQCMVESALGHIGCETLGKLINLSVPQFPHMRNDTGIVFTYLIEFL